MSVRFQEFLEQFEAIFLSVFVAFGLTVFFIWVLRPLAIRLGLVDQPNHRKQHLGSVPLVGGIAMYLGFAFSILTLNISLRDYRSFLAGAGLLIIVGILDDFRELTPKKKFIAQIIAVILMTSWGGLVIKELGAILPWTSYSQMLGNWAVPFTLIGALAIINAINMSDGLDGLAAGYVFIALGAMLVLVLGSRSVFDMRMIILLLAMLAAFILFNMRMPWRKSAYVFMGDAGSMFLGFALIWFIISLTQSSEHIMKPVTALWIVALPLFDMVGVSLRRLLKGKPVFQADRSHFHHIIQVAGYSSNKTTFVLLILSAIMAVIGVIGVEFLHIQESIMFMLFLVLFALYFFGMQHAWKLMKVISKK